MTEQRSSAFSAEQFDVLYPPGVERHYWNIARNGVIARALRKSGAAGPMLEVGCGKGLVVRYLRSQGLDVRGVELSPVPPLEGMTEHMRTGIDVFDLGPQEAARIRTILLLDVIEHLDDPVGFMRKLREGFPALRTLIVTVPARQELFSNFDRFNGHHLRYDTGSLTAHLSSTGAKAVHVGYFFHLLYPSARLLLRMQGERPVEFNVPRSFFAKAVHRLIGILLFLDSMLLPARWRGTSMLGVAHL